jgi:CBS domain-containing protein
MLLIDGDAAAWQPWYTSVQRALRHCGYVHADGEETAGTDPAYCCASIADWEMRYAGLLTDPIDNDIYRARSLFDLLPVHGERALYERIAAAVDTGMNQRLLYLLANDCLANLPPLTFFRDAIVDGTGTHSEVFDLARSALSPLVDVGRVFGLAAQSTLGASTSERFRHARNLLPAHEAVFREASAALRAVLYQQARAGIRERTNGAKIPPSLLSAYDRQVLKNAFRAILRLLEFTVEHEWLEQH